MALKTALKRLFPGLISFRNRVYNNWKHARFKGKKLDEVFNSIYRENHWNDNESVSGTGSNLEQTAAIVAALPALLTKYEIKTFVDIPCGDWNWMKRINMDRIHYIGIDIVEDLVKSNNEKYGAENRLFLAGDLTSTPLPISDIIFCRDCLVHLSYEHIHQAIANIRSSGAKYLLTTTFPQQSNYNIVSGNWRPINLQAAPFNFPDPLELIHEGFDKDDRFADKSLGLWRISEMKPSK